MQSKCKVIAVANQKGGVGKTTTTEHFGIGLAKAGKKVLLIDLDPQANLTACLGWQNVDALDHTVSDVIEASIRKEPTEFKDVILHHDEGVDLVPSNISLAVYKGTVVEVYKITHWAIAGTYPMQTRQLDPKRCEGRIEFIGSIAEQKVRNKYIDRDVSQLFKFGDANPVKTIFQ